MKKLSTAEALRVEIMDLKDRRNYAQHEADYYEGMLDTAIGEFARECKVSVKFWCKRVADLTEDIRCLEKQLRTAGGAAC